MPLTCRMAGSSRFTGVCRSTRRAAITRVGGRMAGSSRFTGVWKSVRTARTRVPYRSARGRSCSVETPFSSIGARSVRTRPSHIGSARRALITKQYAPHALSKGAPAIGPEARGGRGRPPPQHGRESPPHREEGVPRARQRRLPRARQPDPGRRRVAALRAENARLKAERDLLKNAAAYFANPPSRPSGSSPTTPGSGRSGGCARPRRCRPAGTTPGPPGPTARPRSGGRSWSRRSRRFTPRWSSGTAARG